MAEYDYGKVLEARHRWLEEYWNKVSKSVVRIECNSRMWGLGLHANKQGFGSGFVLCQNEGRVLVITCGHVISDYFSDDCLSMKIIVSFSNGFETKDVSILSTAKHSEQEIGLLAVRAPELQEIPAFEIARDLSLGCTNVYMVSFPDKIKSPTHGIGNLGSLHECGLEWQTDQDGFEDLIITDIACSSGSSGAALLDYHGNVFGILIGSNIVECEEPNSAVKYGGQMKLGLHIVKIVEAIKEVYYDRIKKEKEVCEEEVPAEEKVYDLSGWKEICKELMTDFFEEVDSRAVSQSSHPPPRDLRKNKTIFDQEYDESFQESLLNLEAAFRKEFLGVDAHIVGEGEEDEEEEEEEGEQD